MSVDLGRRLLAAGVLQPGELRHALFDALVRERPLARTLVASSSAVRDLLSRAFDDGEHPVAQSVVPHPELLAALPPGLATRLLVVPLRKDPRTGTVDVALVDPRDAHARDEVAFHLAAPVRAIAAPLEEIERALLLVDRRPSIPVVDPPPAAPDPPPKTRRARVSTADYEAAPRPALVPVPTPSPDEEIVVPLVRRARASMAPPPPEHVAASLPPPSLPPPSLPPPSLPPASLAPPSRVRASLAPPTTTPFERAPDSAPRVQMVVDFSAAARRERDEAPATRRGTPDPAHRPIEPKRPPFPSLTPVLEAIDVAADRDSLVAALLRGLLTTASCAALFAPRRGRFVGIGAAGGLDPDHVRGSLVPPTGACGEAITRGERLAAIDPASDRELHQVLDLARLGPAHVLLHPSFVADKVALLLVAFGTSDVLEASRRARVLSTAASGALSRLLRR